ncbi:MAG: hypothetical protein CL600_07870 [Alteromonas sp.]|nr:hypothetical protein [Alteromonas sp.]
MSNINWDLAPEGTETFEKLLGSTMRNFCKPFFWFNGLTGRWVRKEAPELWEVIATRPQPEYPPLTQSLIDEAEQCGEPEWTHGIPPDGTYCKVNHDGEFVNCYLVGRDDMGAFVYRIDGQYHSKASESSFKPIKPTISKAEAWDKLIELSLNRYETQSSILEIQEKYDVEVVE